MQGVFQSAENVSDNNWSFHSSNDAGSADIDSATLEVVTEYVIRGINKKVTIPKKIILHFDTEQKMITRQEERWYGEETTYNGLHASFKNLHGFAYSMLFAK